MAGEMAREGIALEVARLFFDRELTKVEIGARLGISRFRVARLLREARRRGLVRIEFRDSAERDRELAERMEQRYELDLCAVAAPAAEPRDAVTRLAADVLAEIVEARETVGIAWGSTLAAVVDRLPERHHAALSVVPLAGGSGRLDPERAPSALARRFATRLGATHRELYAPAFVASAELREALVREPEVADVMGEYGHVTTAVIGIGAWTDDDATARSSLIASGALTRTELADLRTRGAVGDLVVHPFDRRGRFVAPELARRAVAIGLDALAAVPRLVAVAGGSAKTEAMQGALATGLISVLVTDADAAAAVLGTEPAA